MIAGRIAEILIGDSRPMQELRNLILKFGPTRLPVLIQGPTGSGKELVAQALHLVSGRTGPLAVFNVCALSEAMFEDALFGHVRGAFTGAVADRAGYLAEAHGGTLFLDEIGSLALPMQAKLLRAVETRTYRAVGARMDRQSDFRTIAATHESLDAEVAASRFRADLLHRLGGVVLRVPALKDRPEDVPALARHFMRLSGAGACLTASVQRVLCAHSWPGSVRELLNVTERMMVLSEGHDITASMANEAIGLFGVACSHPRTPEPEATSLEAYRLRAALDSCDWNTAAVASRLNVNRTTVYRRMERFGLERPAGAAVPSRQRRQEPGSGYLPG